MKEITQKELQLLILRWYRKDPTLKLNEIVCVLDHFIRKLVLKGDMI